MRARTPSLSCAAWACYLREIRSRRTSLDAHPLAREWYGEKSRRENEAAWKAAHSRLYDHLRRTTREGDPPKDVAALEPLFQSVAHGCKAGRQQEALQTVYVGRICRLRPDGRPTYHAQLVLGAIGPCLAALGWFFDQPFAEPHAGLSEADRLWALEDAAVSLGVLGRLRDALVAHRAARVLAIARQDWSKAVSAIANLAVAELTLGEIVASKVTAAQGVHLRGGRQDEFATLGPRAALAAARAAAGENGGALSVFFESEALQREGRSPPLSVLSLQGAYLGEDMLEGGASTRSRTGLQPVSLGGGVISGPS